MLPYLLDRLKASTEGDSNLLEKTLVVWGSPMADPNVHNHRRCPLLLLGVKLGQIPVLPNGSTVGHQLIEKPGEELIQDLRAALQQNMKMPTLWYPSSDSGVIGQHVSLDHSDGPEEISQHPRGNQPAHARPKNDRALTQLWHGETPIEVERSSSLARLPRRYQPAYGIFTELSDQGSLRLPPW